MSRIKEFFGYTWAALSIPIILAFIIGSGFLFQTLFVKPGVTVSARWTGGEVQQTINHDSYQTLIHRPVFDGFWGDINSGYVQIDWKAKKRFPPLIREDIDYNQDGVIDFQVKLNTTTNQVTLNPLRQKAISLSEEKVMVLKDQRSIRVTLRK